MITDKITANERYSICKNCEEFRTSIKQCRICGCFMPLKVRLAFEKCPKEKWSETSCAHPSQQASEKDLND